MYFTIFIPLYNREKTVKRTLDNLVSQDFKDFEVVVVDDGSTDGGANTVMEFSDKLDLKYIFKENGGKHTALNKGIEVAQGDFFLICDSDDWMMDKALSTIHDACEKIKDDDDYSGVMFRCKNHETNEIIGDLFPCSPFISSYIDFHFGSGLKHKFIDCCEANKTAILKKFRFPEPENTKMVPEAYIFDQIGIQYKLYCCNEPVKLVEYSADGMTKDKQHYYKNAVGYLHDYVLKLDVIFKKIKVPFKAKVIIWWKYWNAQKNCCFKNKPKVKQLTLLGVIMYFATPILNVLKG